MFIEGLMWRTVFMSLCLGLCHQQGAGAADIVGSKKYITEKRQTADFTRLVFELNGNLELQQGPVAEIRLEGDDNILPLITTEVVDSVLYIKERSLGLFQNIKPGKPIVVALSVNNLTEVVFTGEGQLTSHGALQFDSLSLSLAGAARAELELNVQALKAQIPGTGEYILKGSAKAQKIILEGTGLFDGRNLLGDTATVSISGTGRALLNVSEDLHVVITGSGEVSYVGTPKITQVIQGLGKVEALPKVS